MFELCIHTVNLGENLRCRVYRCFDICKNVFFIIEANSTNQKEVLSKLVALNVKWEYAFISVNKITPFDRVVTEASTFFFD